MRVFHLLFAVLLLAAFSVAQDGEAPTEIGGDLGEEAQEPELLTTTDLESDYIFSNFPDKKFVLGETVKLMVSLTNIGQTAFNISQLGCSLLHPMDYSILIQNYTALEIGVPLEPDIQGSYRYLFASDGNYEPRDFGLLCKVLFNDVLDNNYASIVFNGTIDFIESDGGLDGETLFTYFAIIAATLLAVVLGQKMWVSMRRKLFGKSRYETGTRNVGGVDNEWLEGIVGSGGKRRGKRRS